MATRVEKRKLDLIGKLSAQVLDRLDRDSGAAARFVHQYYRDVAPDDIMQASEDCLYGGALSLWNFAQKRPPDAASIRVYNPRAEEHGWKSAHTVIEIVNDDMPFLVDSLTADLNHRGLTVHLVIHPILRVSRDAKGNLTALHDEAAHDEAAHDEAVAESFMHIEITEQSSPEALESIRDAVAGVLGEVRCAVADWREMRAKAVEIRLELETAPPPLPHEEIAEARAFLAWLEDNQFTFLGYQEFDFEVNGDDGALRSVLCRDTCLGILRDTAVQVFEVFNDLAALPPEVSDFIREPKVLLVSKTNRRSRVHRSAHMDAVGVKKFNAAGEVVGERLFVGLFTSVAYSSSPRSIPFLRRKIDAVITRTAFAPSGHDAKALLHILETYPRDELFQISEDDLHGIALGILHLQERQHIALFPRIDPFERFASCLVYVARDRYDTALRQRFQAILEEAFNGPVTAFYPYLAEESVLARVLFIVKTVPGRVPDFRVEDIQDRLIEAGRTWRDHLSDSLIEAMGEERGLGRLAVYAEAFPAGYRERFNADAAVFDIQMIEAALESARLGMNLYRPIESPADELRFKIYHAGGPVPLSDVLPMLENMGLKVISEVPYAIELGDDRGPVWIHDFAMQTPAGLGVDLAAVKEKFQDAFAAIWSGAAEDDGFNRLVLFAGLGSRAVTMLRALCKYLRQARIAFSQDYMAETLASNPEIVRLLVALFEARFDPAERKQAEARATRIGVEIETSLDAVANLDQDRILRRFLNVVRATLRTNFFQRDAEGEFKPYISFKIDSRAIDDLPLPRPMVEIFVYSPRVEAVHLRGGLVARGGIRWSDRREDFRTEILGLMKAQMVKNAVIVPVGAKGGFVVKRPPAEGGREALTAEGIACYRTMMSGLLDITDNLDRDDVVPPPDVVRHDGDDPYLVVAADKGTATFSDIANGIAIDYGLWLGDAFASGGSVGYDHKKMGITARGAWESVKRHFREIGHDTQSADFNVIGVGDMSGDVFGNGMLLSRHIRLVGAFNHLHIFIDPSPSAEKSWKERARLFELPRSNWADYDAKLISKGGGVFDRKAKSIPLSPEMRELLGVSRDKATPNELITMLLKAKVDLLWFGGIGTSVKASGESHAEVGDRANDALRVDAAQLRCRVVGEGANLGLTQRARVEYALGGGRINTDAIDNSAGVDCSDHEVNIKVLLGDVVDRGDMTEKQRNQLLDRMTDEVGELVLRDNYLQTEAISVAEAEGVDGLGEQIRVMRDLERSGLLDRGLEFLPDDETLIEREAAHRGLVRPELAVLLGYAKLSLYAALLESDVPDDPKLIDDLILYFPKPLRKKYAKPIARHRLRREIVATVAANSLVNRVGAGFVGAMMDQSGMEASAVVRAYAVVRDSFELRELWAEIEALDNVADASVQTAMLLEIRGLIGRCVLWLLRNARHPLDIAESVAEFRPGISALVKRLDAMLTAEDRRAIRARGAKFAKRGAPKELAQRISALDTLAAAFDIVSIARGGRIKVEEVGALYFQLGSRLGFDWLRAAGDGLTPDSHWEDLAISAVVDELHGQQARLAQQVLDAAGGAKAAAAVLEAWLSTRERAVQRIEQMIAELKAAPAVDLSMLTVASRQLRMLISG